jgi:hypothetical protein
VRRGSTPLLQLILAAALVSPARADDTADAERLFEEAVALSDRHDFAEACARFEESYRLRPAPSVRLNLAICAARDAHFRRAWLLYTAVADEYDRMKRVADAELARDPASEAAQRRSRLGAAGAQLARTRAATLAPFLARVVVRVAAPALPGLAIRIGDRVVPAAAELVELVDPTEFEVVATAPDHVAFRASVRGEIGRQVVVEIPALAPIVARTAPDPAAVAARARRLRLATAVGLSSGGLLLTGGILAAAARSQYHGAANRCAREPVHNGLVCGPADADAIAGAHTRADIATALGIAGGIAAVAAVTLYFTAPSERAIALTTGPGAGLAITGRF